MLKRHFVGAKSWLSHLNLIQEGALRQEWHHGICVSCSTETKVMQFSFWLINNKMIEKFEVLLLLAALAGGIVTRAFVYYRYRQISTYSKKTANSANCLRPNNILTTTDSDLSLNFQRVWLLILQYTGVNFRRITLNLALPAKGHISVHRFLILIMSRGTWLTLVRFCGLGE